MRPRGYVTDGSEMLIGIGTVHQVTGPDDDKPEVAGVLWVPDPEQKRGWRERYVDKPASVKPGGRPLGFGKPR